MNTKTSLSVVLVLLTLGACERNEPAPPPAPAPAPRADADNTRQNTADRDQRTKTPIDQSNTETNTKISADIRRAIMDDSTMSMDAQNCKVITDASGVVTLRGPVASQAEKDAIEAKAKAVAGVTRVVNELEVKRD